MPIDYNTGTMDITDEERDECLKIAEHFELSSDEQLGKLVEPEIYAIATELMARGLAGHVMLGQMPMTQAILTAIRWGMYLTETGHVKKLVPEKESLN